MSIPIFFTFATIVYIGNFFSKIDSEKDCRAGPDNDRTMSFPCSIRGTKMEVLFMKFKPIEELTFTK